MIWLEGIKLTDKIDSGIPVSLPVPLSGLKNLYLFSKTSKGLDVIYG
jgi:hypothetical protein